MRHVQHFAVDLLQFLQGEGRLAAAGTADQHQRRRCPVDFVLHVVQRQRLVEIQNLTPLRMQVSDGLCFLRRQAASR